MRFMTAFIVSVAVIVVAGTARAEILLKIDKSTQQMTVMRDGGVMYTWPVSTGRPGYATPSGSFKAFRMEEDHFSQEWDDAPMPHSIFFTQNGIAVHGTLEAKNLGRPVSHGCVRLSTRNPATLYAMVQADGVLKTKVELTGSERVALGRQPGNTARAERAGGRFDPDGIRKLLAEQAASDPDGVGSVDGRRRGFWQPSASGYSRDDPRFQYQPVYPRYPSDSN
jgi:L,D-transpeptidase-like protein